MININDFKDPIHLMDYYKSINSRIAALELQLKILVEQPANIKCKHCRIEFNCLFYSNKGYTYCPHCGRKL